MLGTENQVENTELENANATVAENEESGHEQEQQPINVDDIALSEDGELAESHHEDPEDDLESEDEPDLTPGVKKRIAKLKAKQEREKAELRAEFDAKLHNLQMSMQQTVQPPAMTEAQMQAQYQQQYGQNPYQHNPYGYADPNQPQVPTYEQFKQWQKQAEEEQRKQAEQAEFTQGVQRVTQENLKRYYQDAEFKTLADSYGNLFNNHMLYALKGAKNPASFIKHVLKNEKDRAALRQLQTKNQFEQVAALTQWATKYETLAAANRSQAVAKPKPIVQPKGGGSVNARVKVGLDVNNSNTWTKENIRAYMAQK